MNLVSSGSISSVERARWGVSETRQRVEDLESLYGVKDDEVSRQTTKILLKWRAPHNSVIAAIIAPLIKHVPSICDNVEWTFQPEATVLAMRLIKWQQDSGIDLEGSNKPDAQQLSAVLRDLYRQSYLDLPHLPFILLLLADHAARFDDSASHRLAQLTEAVFIPWAEMLGCWSLYRVWVDSVYAKLYNEEFADLKRLVGEPREYNQREFEALLRRRGTCDTANPTAQETGTQPDGSNDVPPIDRQWLSDKKFLLDKAEAFLHVKAKLLTVLNSKQLRVRIMPLRNYAGLALQRIKAGESKDDVAARLTVRLLCRSVDECYELLGIVHSLGKPLSSSSNIRFEDHIASPQPNGYRALHTAITYQYHKKREEKIIIEFRILTIEMYRLNEYGAIAALHKRKPIPLQVQGWWDRLPALTTELHRRFGSSRWNSVEQLLAEQELASTSEPIYVFTPRGEIVLLKRGSTPIDFAYHIHTDMGHHAMSVEVNGQVVPHSYPLCNGDRVRIHYDPHFIGPDLSWLLFVATPLAQASIRRGLARLANSNNRGRALIQGTLLKLIRYYKRAKGYNISVNTSLLDDFLMRISRDYKCESVEELYSRIENKSISTDQIMWKFISDELSLGVQNTSGTALQYHRHLVFLCKTCRPVPGEAIVGCEKLVSRSSSTKKLVIHCQEDYNCIKSANPHRLVPLSWAESLKSEEDKFLVFQIVADDRKGLLRELLEIVYRTPRANLFSVDAQTGNDDQAKVSMIVKADSFSQLADIKSQFIQIANLTSISSYLPSPSQQLALVRSAEVQMQPLLNPYTTEEVYTRGSFYDREEPLDFLLKWLDEPLPASSMILHGQRRVGKTSLVKYLINEFLTPRHSILPIYITFQNVDVSSTNSIIFDIAKCVADAVPQPVSGPGGGGAITWLNDVLHKASKRYPRVLIVLDELNVLMDLEKEGKLDSNIYDNLRGLMAEHRSVNWLRVIQDTHFFDPSLWLSAGTLMSNPREFQLRHLDLDWSRKLIVEPTKKCGITLQSEKRLIGDILELTSGSPYLINLICFELVNRVRNLRRSNITPQDLEHVVNRVIFEGDRFFDHFLRNLTGIKRVVMAAVATVCTTAEPRDDSDVIDLINHETNSIDTVTMRKVLQDLAKEGLIELSADAWALLPRPSIPVGIFRRFVRNNLDLRKTIEELNTTSSLHLPQGIAEGR
jgi:(p)ppGpp synthase/HD superfamily hydrolase